MDNSLSLLPFLFTLTGTPSSITSFGSGHIHDTYKLTTKEADTPNYLLQQINHQVFPQVPEMMENITRVTTHIRKKLESQKDKSTHEKVLAIVPTHEGKSFYQDESGNFWRMFEFLEETRSYDRLESEQQAFEGGKAFGRFIALLQDLPGPPLHETILNFHHMPMRLQQLEQAVRENPLGRLKEVQEELVFVEARRTKMCLIQELADEGKLTPCVTHNDTKFNNVLLDENDRALCVIDLDTVMPGYVHFDFGDAIRSGTNTGEEDDADLSRVGVNLDYYRAFAEGFLRHTASFLTSLEKEYLPLSAQMMTFIMGVRFLTDYLKGDVYYTIHDPLQNLRRVRAQFALILDLEDKDAAIRRILGLS